MAKISFGDIVAMAKSGWTPDAVNSMLDRFEAINEKQDDDNDSQGSEENQQESNEESQDDNNSSNDDSGSDDKDAKIKELESKLAAAQAHNRQQDNSGGEQKTLDNLVDDIFQEFFE